MGPGLPIGLLGAGRGRENLLERRVASAATVAPTQSFEFPRWAAAQQGFADAFTRGYTRAKAELASGQEKQDGDAESVFYIDVPRDVILDDEWQPYREHFVAAGRAAGLAKRRDDFESMLDVMHDPDHREATINGKCRWVVMLERPDIALPR